jgi:hypothetical protein
MSNAKTDYSRFDPSPEEAAAGIITKNAMACGICGGPADRYRNHFQCQKNPNHVGDLIVGIFSDLTFDKR